MTTTCILGWVFFLCSFVGALWGIVTLYRQKKALEQRLLDKELAYINNKE